MQGQGTASTRDIPHPARVLSLTLALLVSVSVLSACSLLQKTGLLPDDNDPPVPLSAIPYDFRLQVTASDDLNPDPRDRPSPVQLRVFLVEERSGVADMGFEELFPSGNGSVTPDPVATLMLQPGQQRQIRVAGNHAQTRIVLVAAFRDLYQSHWKASADLQAGRITQLEARLEARSISIVAQP